MSNEEIINELMIRFATSEEWDLLDWQNEVEKALQQKDAQFLKILESVPIVEVEDNPYWSELLANNKMLKEWKEKAKKQFNQQSPCPQKKP